MGIIFAVLAAVSQATLWIFIKKSYDQLSPSVAFFFDAALGLLIWIPFSLYIGVDFQNLPIILIYALISGILSEAFVFYVMSKGEVSYTSTIFTTYPVFTIFFSVLINHEKLILMQYLLIFMVIVGTLIVSFPNKINKAEFKKKSFLIWPLLGALAAGYSDTLSKSIIDRTSATSFLFALAFVQVPIAFAYLKIEKQPVGQFLQVVKKISLYKFAILGGLLNVITVLFLWLSFEHLPASIASPITASYPGMVIIMAIIFLKEKVLPKDFIGFCLILIGIISLSVI